MLHSITCCISWSSLWLVVVLSMGYVYRCLFTSNCTLVAIGTRFCYSSNSHEPANTGQKQIVHNGTVLEYMRFTISVCFEPTACPVCPLQVFRSGPDLPWRKSMYFHRFDKATSYSVELCMHHHLLDLLTSTHYLHHKIRATRRDGREQFQHTSFLSAGDLAGRRYT